MISCKDINHLASDYLDKTLPLKQRIGFIMHVMVCQHCRRFLRQFKTIVAVLPRVGRVTLNKTDKDDIYLVLSKTQE